jgi:hypothetical protein
MPSVLAGGFMVARCRCFHFCSLAVAPGVFVNGVRETPLVDMEDFRRDPVIGAADLHSSASALGNFDSVSDEPACAPADARRVYARGGSFETASGVYLVATPPELIMIDGDRRAGKLNKLNAS